ncbi:MAG: phasin family protein [Pseudomonadota bacterium]
MHNEFSEKFGEFYQRMSKPATDMAKLNMETFSRMTRNSNFLNDFLNAKKLEDITAAQMKLASTMGSEVAKYTQEASKICMDAASEAGKAFTDIVQETVKTTQTKAD